MRGLAAAVSGCGNPQGRGSYVKILLGCAPNLAKLQRAEFDIADAHSGGERWRLGPQGYSRQTIAALSATRQFRACVSR